MIATWATLPETLLVREVRFFTPRRGYRSRVITLVTTLLDPEAYPAAALAELYRSRWQIEVNFRHLKTTMGMEVLHCKSVEGVQKELWMFLLIYNLVRAVMVAAAKRQKVSVSRISFASALHWMRCARAGDTLPRLAIVPHRPNRLEPRVLKRRPKPYDLMIRPRKKLTEELWAATGAQSSG